jgi:hypothetical protein
MVEYLEPLPFFKVDSRRLEFIKRGKIDKSSFWLWAFYGDDGHRWNLCVFSGPSPFCEPKMRTWMCADNNADNLDDSDYITAVYNKEF